jgi:CO dehydrogenase nickel-insertion accessory protein CooC1
MFVVFVVGTAGSGKSLLTASFGNWLKMSKQDVAIVNLDPDPISGVRKDLPAGLDNFFSKALAKKREYKIRNIFQKYVPGECVCFPSAPAEPPMPSTARRRMLCNGGLWIIDADGPKWNQSQ